MTNDWILDVLADLKRFAKANSMPGLAEKLSETAHLAAVEITSAEHKAHPSNGDERAARSDITTLGDSRRA